MYNRCDRAVAPSEHHTPARRARAVRGQWPKAAVVQLSWCTGSAPKQGNTVRKVLYLLVGLLLAIVLGMLYVKFSMPPGQVSATATPVKTVADDPDFGLMVAVVIACWVSAFLPLPRWLSVLLGGAIVWVGLAVMAVTGFFVYMQYPNNTLADGAYTGFLCGIAMVTSRFASVLKYMHREGSS